jgi:hypothetical protein
MQLDHLWGWEKRKLACRIRPETGNPAGDDLRERLAELVGANLVDLLGEMKSTRRKKEEKEKVVIDHVGDKQMKDILNRSHILGASAQAITTLDEITATTTVTSKNHKKVFGTVLKSPPKRVLLEIQRERSKPLRIPDQDENKAATAKLEKKLAKQRAARKKAIEQSNKNEEDNEVVKKTTENKKTVGKVLPHYKGDLFSTGGEYLHGMIYLSRLLDSEFKLDRIGRNFPPHLKNNVEGSDGTFEGTDDLIDGNNNDEKISRVSGITNEEDRLAAGFSESNVTDTLSAKLYCAICLCNWSRNPHNAQRLSSEGAVRAIMQLFLEPSAKITKFCAAAFRYMSEQSILTLSMIEDGAITTISECINSTTDEFVFGNLAITLLNLTRANGKEEKVVEAGIVLSLMNLIIACPELSSTCARGLYNLTCIDNSYALIERVIRALVSLSSTSTSSVKHICAASLCNLADLKLVRPRLVEEGAINVLGTLARGSETRTRRVCAVILQNLSATKSCRIEMVSRNCVGVAYGLSSDQDPIILRCIGLTLSRLALESANCNRIVSESGITSLCNIAVKYPTIPGISQPVATAFQLLSSRPNMRVSIVQEGSITAIASLLRLSVDLFTLRRGVLALCNLLTEPDNHLPIVQQGLIVTLITLSAQDDDIVKDLCALAFLNLSIAEDSRKHIVNAGAISAIINLATHESKTTQSRCAAALCFVSSYEIGMSRMISDGIIPSLVGLVLTDDIETVRYACAALCRLCTTIESGMLILTSGAVPHLVKRVIEGDVITKQFCGAVLSSLSFYEPCRQQLSDMNMTSAMTSLAQLNDDVTKQRCLAAFANLSCEMSVQKEMVQKGVVGIIAQLANSYQEINYICSAKALCNLACSVDSRLQICKEGGVHTLMMISMVQSVDMQTKLLCVIALNNLLDENTVDYMISEGIVGSIANLSKLSRNYPRTANLICEDTIKYMEENGYIGSIAGIQHLSNKIYQPNPESTISLLISLRGITRLCAGILNQLSLYPEARMKMVDKYIAMGTLSAMSGSELMLDTFDDDQPKSSESFGEQTTEAMSIQMTISPESFIICVRTAANLVLCDHCRTKAINAGALRVLEKGSLYIADEASSLQCIKAIFSACSSDSQFLVTIANSTLPLALVTVAMSCTGEKHDYAVKSLSLLSWMPKARIFLQKENFASLLISLILKNLQSSSIRWLVSTLRYLCIGYDYYNELIKLGIIDAISIIYALFTSPEGLKLSDESKLDITTAMSEIYRTLCSEENVDCIDAVGSKETMSFLRIIIETNKNDKDVLYNCALTFYELTARSSESRVRTTSEDSFVVLIATANEKSCIDLTAATIAYVISDIKCRTLYVNPTVGMIAINIILAHPIEDTLNNVLSTLFALSKIVSCRDWLATDPLNTDAHMLKLNSNNSFSSKVKGNVARVVKNLQSDVAEALEEGTVSSLIAMSLEGKSKSKVSDEVISPEKIPLKTSTNVVPACKSDIVPDSAWFAPFTITKGGAAGKGPEAPQASVTSVDGTSEYKEMMEEADIGEVEGKTKMAFAKMQSPVEVRNSYLFSDKDFDQNENESSDDSPKDSDSVANDELTNDFKEESLIDTVDNGSKNEIINDTVEIKDSKNSSPRSIISSQKGIRSPSKNIDDYPTESPESPTYEIAEAKKSKTKQKQAKDSSMGEKAAALGLYN